MKADASVNISLGLATPLRPDCRLFPSSRLDPGMDTAVPGVTHLHSLHTLWPGVARRPWSKSSREFFHSGRARGTVLTNPAAGGLGGSAGQLCFTEPGHLKGMWEAHFLGLRLSGGKVDK